VSQRSKEHAHDYRYFPEPDLPPIVISREWVEEVRARLPELPAQRRNRFMSQYGLPLYDAQLLTASKNVADFFEQSIASIPEGERRTKAKHVSNLILTELSRILHSQGSRLEDLTLNNEATQHLDKLVTRLSTSSSASSVTMPSTGTSVDASKEILFITLSQTETLENNTEKP